MKKIMQKKVKELKRSLVLSEAAEYFEEVGFEAVTMAELAKKCGISVGALYKLFESKDALFYAYVEHQINQLHEEIVQRCKHIKSPEEKLRIVAELKFEAFCSKSKLIFDPIAGDPLFFTKLSLSKKNPAQIIYDYTAQLFEELKEKRSLKITDSMLLSYLFHNFLLGFIEHWLHLGGDLKQRKETTLEMFLKGVEV